MFNVLLSINQLFLLMLFSFFLFFTIRQLFIKRKIFIFLYHLCLFFILFVASVGGGAVQNRSYDRLSSFVLLEANNELESARKNPQNYDSMLQIDLKEFKDSSEFSSYLKKHDAVVDKAESMFIGWFFVLVSEISMVLVKIFAYIFNGIKNRRYFRSAT